MFLYRSPERKRVEFGGNHHSAPGEQSGHGRANQAVNVEQRHDAQRNILLGKRIGVRNIRRRNGQVEMPQGNLLGPPRASAGVQDQGNVIGRGRGRGDSCGSGDKVDSAVFTHFHREHRDLEVGGGVTRQLRSDRRDEKHSSVGIPKKEMKLLIRVSRVQRGCGPGDGGRQKAHDRG